MSFASGLVNSLANPSYTQGLFNLGQQVGGMPARREAAQFDTQATQTQYQGSAAAEQGDIAALSQRKQQLIDMLPSAPNEEARANLKAAIEELNGMAASTKDLAKNNKIDAVIEIQKAIEDESIPMEARQALTDRMIQLESDPEISIGVATKKKDMELASLNSRIEINQARLNAEISELDKLDYGSKEWNAVAAKSSAAAVRESEEKSLERQAKVSEFQESISDSQWTTEKEAYLKSKGIKVPEDKYAKLAAYRAAKKADIENEINSLNNREGAMQKEKAEAFVSFTLNSIAKAGDVFMDAPWADDIEEVITEEMTPEQHQEIVGLVSGMNAEETVAQITSWLQQNYPEAWKRSERLIMKANFDSQVLETLEYNELPDTPENRARVIQSLENAGLKAKY